MRNFMFYRLFCSSMSTGVKSHGSLDITPRRHDPARMDASYTIYRIQFALHGDVACAFSMCLGITGYLNVPKVTLDRCNTQPYHRENRDCLTRS